MKFISFLLASILCLSLTVNSFAVEMDSAEPIPADDETVVEFTQPENEYLNMVLDNMQSDIDQLNEKVEVLEDDVSQINESNAVSDTPVEDVTSEEPEEINPGLGIDESTPTAVNVYALNPITPEDTTGLKSVLLSLIGDYDAIVVEYEFTGSNNYTNYLREVQPDYVWLCSSAIFLVVIYSVFRLGGALFRG